MHKLVLIRHGESQWNLENRFTGWTDIDLSEKGHNDAQKAGQALKEAGFVFDIAYTSVLKRAIHTLWHILDELDLAWIPTENSWRLNERHYGSLQGLNKAETAQKYGDDQVKIWRRSYDILPPALTLEDPRCSHNDPRYQEMEQAQIPLAESLQTCTQRMLPYWFETIAPVVKSGKKVIITAHGNSLRALIKHLDNLSNQEIVETEIPTGTPLIYELDQDLKPIKHYYLGQY